MRNSVLVCLWLGAMLLLSSSASWAETAEEKGLNIMREVDRRDSGWGDSTSKQTMILSNPQGDKRKRTMRSSALEIPDDGDKRVIIFEFPPDMRGTGFLSYSHKSGDDDQWIYLPALKRVKRIASRSKSDSFMGSEFAYEDITGQEIEKHTYRWLRDEVFDGYACFVVESFPVDIRNSGYSRKVSWIDKRYYYVQKIDYFNRKKKYLKTLIFRDYHQYRGKYWRPDIMEMVNHQNGKSTRLIWESYQLQTGLDERDFTHRRLKLER